MELPDRPFVITVMTNYGGGDGDAAIREAAKAAFDYFTRLQRSTPYGTRVPRHVFEATGPDTARFRQLAARFLGPEVSHVETFATGTIPLPKGTP